MEIGAKLAALYVGYEQATEYRLGEVYAPGEQVNWRVERKMRLSPDKTALVYNDRLTLEGIPLRSPSTAWVTAPPSIGSLISIMSAPTRAAASSAIPTAPTTRSTSSG
ncbi:MAG TPA: hypothetical protein VGP82_15495 [Ktedonobacterales bacterium]|nr:hypothetical protein [Ktedonobacterales bacterium]